MTKTSETGAPGIVCRLSLPEDGSVRLVFDDAVCSENSSSEQWTTAGLYTWRDFEADSFLQSTLSETELAEIGLAIVARLAALARKGGASLA